MTAAYAFVVRGEIKAYFPDAQAKEVCLDIGAVHQSHAPRSDTARIFQEVYPLYIAAGIGVAPCEVVASRLSDDEITAIIDRHSHAHSHSRSETHRGDLNVTV